MPIGVKQFANTYNPFQKFLLLMLTEQSIGREFICSCVWLLLLASTSRCAQSGESASCCCDHPSWVGAGENTALLSHITHDSALYVLLEASVSLA